MSRWVTAAVALLLAAALGTSSLAGCLAAAAPQAQMACCKKGHDRCPMHRSPGQSAADCCRHDAQRQQLLTSAEQPPVRPSTIALQPIAAAPHVTTLVAPESTPFARYSSRSAGPPAPRPSLSTVLLI